MGKKRKMNSVTGRRKTAIGLGACVILGASCVVTAFNGQCRRGVRLVERMEANQCVAVDASHMPVQACLGMTVEEARSLLPEPSEVNIADTEDGVHEQWIYLDASLYFKNGILAGTQNTQPPSSNHNN